MQKTTAVQVDTRSSGVSIHFDIYTWPCRTSRNVLPSIGSEDELQPTKLNALPQMFIPAA